MGHFHGVQSFRSRLPQHESSMGCRSCEKICLGFSWASLHTLLCGFSTTHSFHGDTFFCNVETSMAYSVDTFSNMVFHGLQEDNLILQGLPWAAEESLFQCQDDIFLLPPLILVSYKVVSLTFFSHSCLSQMLHGVRCPFQDIIREAESSLLVH